MSQETRPVLQSSINTDLYDNNINAISAADVRTNMIDITDSVPFLIGTNTFIGDNTITGSLIISGSGTDLTIDGDAIITGSLILSSSQLWDPVISRYDNTPLIVRGRIDLNEGNNNIIIGEDALSNADAPSFGMSQNTAIGKNALWANLSNNNTAIGYYALRRNFNSNGNTALGNEAGNETVNLTGDNNTFLGNNASYGTATTITNATAVGANVTLTNSNTVILGNNTNVGIGNTNPPEKLTVQGNILASGNITGSNLIINNDIVATNFSGSFLQLNENGSGLRMTNIGAFDNSSGDFRIFSTEDLIISTGGDSGTVVTFDKTSKSATFTGAITAVSFIGDGSGLTNLLSSYTVASLPVGTVGDRAYVTDADSPTYLGTLTGGGTITCPVFYNGTNWVSA